jgi:hypothetical protein
LRLPDEMMFAEGPLTLRRQVTLRIDAGEKNGYPFSFATSQTGPVGVGFSNGGMGKNPTR